MRLRKINLDALGMGVSVACAIHCALLPVAMATLPFFGGISRFQNRVFEYGMIGLAFVVGIMALRHGYRRHHHRAVPVLLFIGGMILLIAKQIWQGWEGVLLSFAVMLILAAHGMNYRLIRRRGMRFSRIRNQQ